MALNGSYRTGSSDNHYFEISWEVVKQSTTDNTSTLKWTATCENCRQANYDTLTFDVYYFYIKPKGGSNTKHTFSVAAVTSTDKIITLDLGTTTIPHTSTTETQHFEISDISYRVRFSKSTGSGSSDSNKTALDNSSRSYYIEPVVPAVQVLTAPDFNDEANPTITYKNSYTLQEGTKTYAAISFTGGKDDVPYREISSSGTSYTFNLTDNERKTLRQGITTGSVRSVRFYIKTTFSDGESTWHYLTRNLSLINHEPILIPTVKDISPEALALTGDENVFVKYVSMAEYSTGATAKKEAEIVSQSVQCGSKTVTDMYNGVIQDVESGTFVFNATDNRGIHAETVVVEKQLIDYLKPTCYQKLEIALTGETGAEVTLTVSGNYFNGSFGDLDNTIKLETRYSNADGTMGDWITLNGTPTFNGNTYELTVTFDGFSYENAYTFQSRLTDRITYVQSSQYTIRLMPVFDWSETDFNFNVPIKLNGETVLRHNATADNTVLSASGGHIYIRPGGTDDTSGETIIYPDGSIQFGGEVTFADGSVGGGSIDPDNYYTKEEVDNLISEAPTDAADYIVETGTASMGSNGTWYWTKWNSGKAECYGVRNYGNMAITAIWGDVYASVDTFTQTLPANLFNAAPDYININFHHANNGSGWIINTSSSQPSATATGSFKVAAPASVTAQATHISFNVIGRWK